MTDLLTENARLRAVLKQWQSNGCPYCSGDCSSANPPIAGCLMRETAAALATPAPDAVQEAARGRLLEKALKVAMGYLAPQQPDDSSAVDDWFLACAAVQAELDDTDGRIEAWLDAAIRARGEGQPQEKGE